MAKKVTSNKTNDTTICQVGTPRGIRISITIGDVNGIIENVVAIIPCGSLTTTTAPIYIANISGIIIIITNCWVSVSLSTAAPIAA